jgi:DegV family protein with EDD domain
MPSVAVVSDTTGYLPPPLVAARGIHLVPLYVNFGTAQRVSEDRMGDLDTFYDELRSSDELPTTSGPRVEDFVAVYEPLLAGGGEVVSVHISGGLSDTVAAAQEAAERLEAEGKGGARVSVIDSSTGGGGLGLMSLVAARAAEEAADAAEVVERVLAARGELKTWLALDTLEFLKRSDRAGAAKSWIGSTFGVKPILTVESEIMVVERVRTDDRVFERLVDYARQRAASGASAWCVQHVQAPERAARLAAACREVFGREPEFLSEIGPVLGVHTGPRVLALGAMPPGHVD